MKPSDKLRVYYMRREADIGGFFPLGQGTKSDLGYLLYALEPIWKELERRGYDPKTLRLSIEPQQGNERFASQRDGGPKDSGRIARGSAYDHIQEIERALATAWIADDSSQSSSEVAESTGLSVSQVQSAGRRFFSQRDKDLRRAFDAVDIDGARVRVRIHYLRGTFMMEPESGWQDLASKDGPKE